MPVEPEISSFASNHRLPPRRFLAYMGAAAAGAMVTPCLALSEAKTKQAPKPPNVLFIFSDDHALRTIGAYGSGLNRTPSIDRLASEGILFANSYCGNSISQPSRAAILTGKHSHLNGVRKNSSPWNAKQTVFTRLLKQQAGYQTALFGKWHLNSDPSTEFDTWEILVGAGRQGYYYNPEFRSPAGETRREGYSTDLITTRTIEWLERERDPEKPFFLMCQFKAPHVPRMPPLRYLQRYGNDMIPEPATLLDDYKTRHHASTAWMMVGKQSDELLNIFPSMDDKDWDHSKNQYLARMTSEQRRQYLEAYHAQNEAYRHTKAEGGLEGHALTRYRYQRFIKDYLRCVDAIDDNVGRLLDWLEANGLEEDTLVVYSSDQSYFTGEHGWAEKRWMYEEGLTMPLIMRWPGHIRAGTRQKAMVQNIDYAPTFLEIAGLQAPAEMQGDSLVPLLKGETPGDWRESIYYHYYEHGAHNVPRHDGVRTERYKLIHFYTDDTWELYDLKKDPNEIRNVYAEASYKPIKKRMKKELFRLRRAYKVPKSVFTQ